MSRNPIRIPTGSRSRGLLLLLFACYGTVPCAATLVRVARGRESSGGSLAPNSVVFGHVNMPFRGLLSRNLVDLKSVSWPAILCTSVINVTRKLINQNVLPVDQVARNLYISYVVSDRVLLADSTWHARSCD